MLHFECDYACGAADGILRALVETNHEQTAGYGEDEHCEAVRRMIRERCGCPEAGVHFFTGGTQVNQTAIAASIRPFEGALCADCGHINVHETGAIEATGHKVLPIPSEGGKISAEGIRKAMEAHLMDGNHEHMVRPGLVYVSYPTELGTLYTREELSEISGVCRQYGLKLYLDGARLIYALAAQPEVDLAFLASVCDAFTIGGTKAGLLFGEALILTNPAINDCFRYHLKQHGAMLAKGRLLGVQFEALLKDDYGVSLADTANGYAQQLKRLFLENGCSLICDTVTNQIFPVVPNRVLERLREKYCWSFWQAWDEEHTGVRFCTNVTTSFEDVAQLMSDLQLAFDNP